MKLKLFFLPIILLITLVSCQSNENKVSEENLGDTHKVVVLEVLQTTNYTYLRVKENDAEQWLALPKMTAQKDEVYYYEGGMLMTDFPSKELNRTFEKILFLESVRKTPEVENNTIENPHKTTSDTNPHGSNVNPHGTGSSLQGGKPEIEKKEVKVNPVSGSVTIGELFKNKDKYAGNVIKVTGSVTKFNAAIMGKNWVHIQDGTDFSGNFDLTITTQATVKEGDNVVFEGKIVLDKDFGYGYSYKLIMEEAQKK